MSGCPSPIAAFVMYDSTPVLSINQHVRRADSDTRIRNLCGICLGEVGAIDPARVGPRLCGGRAAEGRASSSSSGGQVDGCGYHAFRERKREIRQAAMGKLLHVVVGAE